MGLDRMQELLSRAHLESVVGSPEGPQFIHVTGTNGKGSVTAYLQSMLVEQGYRTGAFFSPFVYDPRERVQFGREMISEADLARLTAELIPAAESLSETEFGGTTEFEFKTALGFRYWALKNAEWVALEVGLGGRLDATNVVKPKASVIVSISLDHTNVLGDTIEAIAHEKAGIIKNSVPVMVGEVPRTALEVIERAAAEHSAPIWRFGREITLSHKSSGFSVSTPYGTVEGLVPGLLGVKQPHNMSLALAALQAAGAYRDSSKIGAGTRETKLPGRFERTNVNGLEVLLDGAHNPGAASVLRENLDQYYPGRHIILLTGMVAGHDPVHYYEKLKGLPSSVHIVPIEFHRALSPKDLAQSVQDLFARVHVHESLTEGLDAAVREALPNSLLVITGSFYLVGEAGAALRKARAPGILA